MSYRTSKNRQIRAKYGHRETCAKRRFSEFGSVFPVSCMPEDLPLNCTGQEPPNGNIVAIYDEKEEHCDEPYSAFSEDVLCEAQEFSMTGIQQGSILIKTGYECDVWTRSTNQWKSAPSGFYHVTPKSGEQTNYDHIKVICRSHDKSAKCADPIKLCGSIALPQDFVTILREDEGMECGFVEFRSNASVDQPPIRWTPLNDYDHVYIVVGDDVNCFYQPPDDAAGADGGTTSTKRTKTAAPSKKTTTTAKPTTKAENKNPRVKRGQTFSSDDDKKGKKADFNTFTMPSEKDTVEIIEEQPNLLRAGKVLRTGKIAAYGAWQFYCFPKDLDLHQTNSLIETSTDAVVYFYKDGDSEPDEVFHAIDFCSGLGKNYSMENKLVVVPNGVRCTLGLKYDWVVKGEMYSLPYPPTPMEKYGYNSDAFFNHVSCALDEDSPIFTPCPQPASGEDQGDPENPEEEDQSGGEEGGGDDEDNPYFNQDPDEEQEPNVEEIDPEEIREDKAEEEEIIDPVDPDDPPEEQQKMGPPPLDEAEAQDIWGDDYKERMAAEAQENAANGLDPDDVKAPDTGSESELDEDSDIPYKTRSPRKKNGSTTTPSKFTKKSEDDEQTTEAADRRFAVASILFFLLATLALHLEAF